MAFVTPKMFARLFAVMALLSLAPGCARGPGGSSSSGTGPQLFVTMTVAGQIRPAYFYFVLFNNANDPNGAVGPIPVVAAPYGNGYAGGAFTQVVRYDASQPNNGFGVYGVVPGTNLRQLTYLGPPVQSNLSSDGKTLAFQIPLSQLQTMAVPPASIGPIQINFLTTNVVPTDPNYNGTKEFDALGDARQPGGVNDYITINTRQAAIYNNTTNFNEPSGDVTQFVNGSPQTVNDPDLDITNWSVEVRD